MMRFDWKLLIVEPVTTASYLADCPIAVLWRAEGLYDADGLNRSYGSARIAKLKKRENPCSESA